MGYIVYVYRTNETGRDAERENLVVAMTKDAVEKFQVEWRKTHEVGTYWMKYRTKNHHIIMETETIKIL